MATKKSGKVTLGSSDGRYKPVGDDCECMSGPAAGTALISGNTFAQKALIYANVDGEAMFEGDIVLGRVDELDNDAGPATRSIGISGADKRWPNATIPYEIDAAMPNQSRITGAIAHWEANTRIRFVLRTSANAASYPNYVRFFAGSGCSSSVGMRGGQQNISLGSGCSLGNAIHEIGHAVGLWHEQSREDRDARLRVRWENITAGFEHNFSQHISDGDDLGAYDFGSIMHYPLSAFSKNGQPTLQVIGSVPAGTVIGQRSGLSAGDIAGVHAMYPPSITLKEARKDTIRDPITVKEIRKDPIRDPITIKEIRKDPIQDPITVKEARKDPIQDPVTLRESIGGFKIPFRPNFDPSVSAMPFIAASPTQFPDALAGQGQGDAEGEYQAALAQLQDVEAMIAQQTQALGDLFRLRDELHALITAMESGT
jgi:hypothetical protein